MLRTTIRNLIIESKYVSPMNYPHLACRILDKKNNKFRQYMLFHKNIINFVHTNVLLKEHITEHIIGYALTYVDHENSCNKSSEVLMIAAESPYGPTLYDIILADNAGIRSDRGSTKSKAISIYENYLTSRPDVEIKYLDSPKHSITKGFTGDDCSGRDYYALWDIEDYYPEGEFEIKDYERGVLYDEYPNIIDLPLEQEQLYGLSFHMNNMEIENEVDDLLSDPFIDDILRLVKKGNLAQDASRFVGQLGKYYFDSKYI